MDGMRNSKTYFTSNTHVEHTNIIHYCQHPFANAAEMDTALIENWNARVGDQDVVYHLGDFTLEGHETARRMFARLRGRIGVLGYPWHHDRGWVPAAFGPSRFVSASATVGRKYSDAAPREIMSRTPSMARSRSVPSCTTAFKWFQSA